MLRPLAIYRILWLLAALAFSGLPGKAVAPAGHPSGTKPLIKVTLQTDWFAQPEHGGFIRHSSRGYYREAGLDVDIRQGNPRLIRSK